MLIDVTTIEYKWFNDRDFEVPLLLGLVEHDSPNTFLDVGAHYSWATYAPGVRKLIPAGGYSAIDILNDVDTKHIVDFYTVGNILETDNLSESYDFVSCISVLEHCGITTYKRDDVIGEQNKVMSKMLELATHSLLVTFPFGLPGIFPGQYQNITADQVERYTQEAERMGFTVECQYLYNKFPQGKLIWRTITPALARQIPIDLTKGVQCNCVFYACR